MTLLHLALHLGPHLHLILLLFRVKLLSSRAQKMEGCFMELELSLVFDNFYGVIKIRRSWYHSPSRLCGIWQRYDSWEIWQWNYGIWYVWSRRERIQIKNDDFWCLCGKSTPISECNEWSFLTWWPFSLANFAKKINIHCHVIHSWVNSLYCDRFIPELFCALKGRVPLKSLPESSCDGTA